jgi:hypothetical protein
MPGGVMLKIIMLSVIMHPEVSLYVTAVELESLKEQKLHLRIAERL